MESEFSSLKESTRSHIQAVLQIFNDLSLTNDSAGEKIQHLNEEFINSILMPIFQKVSEAELSTNLKQISEDLSQEQDTTHLYPILVRKNKPATSYDPDHYLFTKTKASRISDYRKELPHVRRIIRGIQSPQADQVHALLTIVAVMKVRPYSDAWQPYFGELITKSLGENLPQGLDLTSNGGDSSQSIINYLIEKDGVNIVKAFARGEGLEARVRQRLKENGTWDWIEDNDFLRFHVFSNFWTSFGLNEEIDKKREEVIKSLRDLLPEKY